MAQRIYTDSGEEYSPGGGMNSGVDTVAMEYEAEAIPELFHPDMYAMAITVVLVEIRTESPLAITFP